MITVDTKRLSVLEVSHYARLAHPHADLASLIPSTG